MINPAAIPQIPGDMAVLGQHATAVSGVGTAFAETGRRVHAAWQGLAPFYTAPESGQLLAATGPVQSVSASVGQDISGVGAALSTYATEVAAIKTRLDALRAQAEDFVAMTRVTEDWREDEGEVDRHNQLLSDVNTAVADFMDAQRRCANSILALYTDARYTAENGDGTVTEYEFGYTREMLDGALAQEEGLPWGSAEEHDRGFLGDVGAFFGGVGTGAVDMVVGLGGLIGYAEGEWSWSNAGAAWKGLGIFVMALNPIYSTINAHTDLPGLPKGTLHNTLIGAGKAIIAYDTWGEDKSKAAGMATFNIVSAIIGTKGAGAGLRGGGAAVQGSRVAAVSRVGAGAVRAGEFIGRIPSVSDVALGAIRKFPGFQIPHVQLPDVDIPPTHVDTPNVDVPRADTPTVPDRPSVGDAVGDRPLPPAAVITPDGVVDGRAFDPPAPAATPDAPLVRDGVIGGRGGVDAPPTPDTAAPDVPARPDAPGEPLIRDGVIGGRGAPDAPPAPDGNRADAPGGAGAAEPPLIRDGVIDGRTADAAPTLPDPDRTPDPDPAPARAPAPALVGAGDPPLVRDGVIGGRTAVETPAVPAPNRAEVPALVGAAEPPLVRGGVIGGRAGFDAPTGPASGPLVGLREGVLGRLDVDPPAVRGLDTPNAPGGSIPRPDADLPPTRVEADPPAVPQGDAGGGNGPGGNGPGGDGPGNGPDGDGPYDGDQYGDQYYDAPTADGPDGNAPDGDNAPGADGSPPLPPGVHPPLVRDSPLPTEPLGSRYVGENLPDNPNRAFHPDVVEYFTPEMREAARVVVIDGRLHWAHDGSPLDTSGASIIFGSTGTPRAIFVMDENGNLYVSLEQEIGRLHHSSILGGQPVTGAGEIAAVNGVPEVLSRKSGHYRPTAAAGDNVNRALTEQGLDTSGISFEAGFN